jgi:hypothetical protein
MYGIVPTMLTYQIDHKLIRVCPVVTISILTIYMTSRLNGVIMVDRGFVQNIRL